MMPLCPYGSKVRRVGMSAFEAVPMAVIGRPKDSGMGLPASSCRSGLGSKVSRWLGPPSMNSQITDFARGGRCGALGARGSGGAPSAKTVGSRPSWASMAMRAMPPRPALACVRKSRRWISPRSPGDRSLFSQSHMAPS